METNLNVELTIPEIYKAVSGLSGKVTRSDLDRFKEVAAAWPYPLSPEEVRPLESESERSLGGRYRWVNGERSRGLKADVSRAGVRLESLDALREKSPEIAARIEDKIAAAPQNALSKTLSVMTRETIVFYVPCGVAVAEEILLDVDLSATGQSGAMKIWIVLEENAEATLTLNLNSALQSDGNLFLNPMTVSVAANARLHIHEIQSFHAKALSLRDKMIRVEKDGAVDWITVEIGSDRSVSDLTLDLRGDRAQARIDGVYFAADDQRFTMRTRQNHYGKNSYSSLLYKGAVQDQSRSTWTGMIYVDPQAAGTDGYQKNDNLVLSPEARVFARPGLEIITDDVKCSHGTTMTEIDPDQVFYMMSRGIAEAEARALIIDGFFNSVLDKITYEPVRVEIQSRLDQKLNR